jgi:hypothetical protein
MRRTLFTILAGTALFVAAPAVASADNGQGHHHHKRHHQARVRHEKFVGHRHASDVSGGNPGDVNAGNPADANEPTAGTVTSFANNVLTITLTNGNTVSGEVTNGTEVKCENPQDMANNGNNDVEHGDRVSDHGPGGGDNGDNGDRGDDNGNDNMCTITPGMSVRNAELSITGTGAFWDEVELINSSTSTTTSPTQS